MALDEIRQQFGERVEGLDNCRYAAAGTLLQLLVGTLYHAVQGLDLALDELRAHLDKNPSTAEFALDLALGLGHQHHPFCPRGAQRGCLASPYISTWSSTGSPLPTRSKTCDS
jgi:hypothetical protein